MGDIKKKMRKDAREISLVIQEKGASPLNLHVWSPEKAQFNGRPELRKDDRVRKDVNKVM